MEKLITRFIHFFLDKKVTKNQVRNMLPRSFRGSARISDKPPHGCKQTKILFNQKSFGLRCVGMPKIRAWVSMCGGSIFLAWFFCLLFSSRKKVNRSYRGQSPLIEEFFNRNLQGFLTIYIGFRCKILRLYLEKK